jgi:hypothetical protein
MRLAASFICIATLVTHLTAMKLPERQITRLAEQTWRQSAQAHQVSVHALLAPGMLPAPSVKPDKAHKHKDIADSRWRALDVAHPIYNFLRDYYGIKGVQGVRRLARWSPSLAHLSDGTGGILLEGANESDLNQLIPSKGAIMMEGQNKGILYCPALHYGRYNQLDTADSRNNAINAASSFVWYRGIIQQTLNADPIFHCHGLHEWAMQYRPVGAPPPPSADYQAALPLRVSQETINSTVERKGVHCTHVDALKYFAPAATPLNHYGPLSDRGEQLRLEQPACVHAQMDLLKMTLRLQPFVGGDLLVSAVEMALQSRRLDVAASPYDASSYGVDAVPIETSEGRAIYRESQRKLMEEAKPVRLRLLDAYDAFLHAAFDPAVLEAAVERTIVTPNRQKVAMQQGQSRIGSVL